MFTVLASQQNRRALTGLNGDETMVPSDLSYGETFPARVAVLDRLIEPVSQRVWEPLDLTGWTIRAGVGKPFRPPVAGSFTLTFTAEDESTETTAAIPFDASNLQVQSALNTLSKVNAVGGVAVTGSSGYFFITFVNAANRRQITGSPANLAPLSVIEYGTVIEGETQKEVQSIRLLQVPAAYANLNIDSPVATAPVTELQEGGGGFNAKYRIKLDPLPFAGKWTLKVGANETGFLDWNISEEDLRLAIQALASVGENNVQVAKESIGNYIIIFVGTKGNTDMGDLIADASALRVIHYKQGSVTINTAAMEILLGTAEFVDAFWEIEGTPPDGTPRKLWRYPVRVVAPVIKGTLVQGPSIWFYNAAESDLRYARKAIAGKYRIKEDGTFQLFNSTQNKYHTLTVQGATGEEYIQLGAAED